MLSGRRGRGEEEKEENPGGKPRSRVSLLLPRCLSIIGSLGPPVRLHGKSGIGLYIQRPRFQRGESDFYLFLSSERRGREKRLHKQEGRLSLSQTSHSCSKLNCWNAYWSCEDRVLFCVLAPVLYQGVWWRRQQQQQQQAHLDGFYFLFF